MSMRMIGYAAIAGLFTCVSMAVGQTYIVQATTGNPNNNHQTRSEFSITDGKVCLDSGEEWAIPLMVTQNGGTTPKKKQVWGYSTSTSSDYLHTVYSFNMQGNYYSGAAIATNGWYYGEIMVPKNGTLMMKGIGGSGSNSLCMVGYYVVDVL